MKTFEIQMKGEPGVLHVEADSFAVSPEHSLTLTQLVKRDNFTHSDASLGTSVSRTVFVAAPGAWLSVRKVEAPTQSAQAAQAAGA